MNNYSLFILLHSRTMYTQSGEMLDLLPEGAVFIKMGHTKTLRTQVLTSYGICEIYFSQGWATKVLC